MKFAACLLIATFVVAAHAAPAAEQEQLVRAVRQTAGQLPANDPLSQLLQDSLLETSGRDEVLSRSIRQADMQNSPLGQLLFDILQIPQAALQAVSRLLTNPGNTIGQSFNYNRRQQQPMMNLQNLQ